MIGTIIVFMMLTACIGLAYIAWSNSSKEERAFFMNALFKGVIFSLIALVILFFIVNLF